MKKRDFLKGMAVAGAAGLTGGLGWMPRWIGPGPAAATEERNNLIFISDLHLNANPQYAWLSDHAPDLAQFLDETNSRSDVAEVILLGDVADPWVTPAEESPPSFSDVLSAGHNAEVVESLKAIDGNPDISLTFVAGNHDMLSFLDENLRTLREAFPHMTLLCESPGLGAYCRDNVILAEHGHRYTLFNAPDVWSRPDGHLPLGYFISRLVASMSETGQRGVTTRDVLDRCLTECGYDAELRGRFLRGSAEGVPQAALLDDRFVTTLFLAVARWTGHGLRDPFVMDGRDGFTTDPTVADIARAYNSLFSGWPDRQDIVSPYTALFSELNLVGPAWLLLHSPDPIPGVCSFSPKIVLFGHTHEASFYHDEEQNLIYANTGTWVDSVKERSWVEVEITGDDRWKDYTVSLWCYGEADPRYSATVRAES